MINFEDGVMISPPKVIIDGIEHEVIPGVWQGNTPLSAYNLNRMQENIDGKIEEAKTAVNENADEIEKLKNKVLLWEGVAGAGDSITLNDDYTKYNFLHIVTGTETACFGSVLIASTVSINNEIGASKIYVSSGGQMQTHSARFFTTNNNTILTLDSAAYQPIAAANVANVQNPVACKVRRIYGTM